MWKSLLKKSLMENFIFFVQCGDLDIFRSDYYFSSYNCSYYRHCWYYAYGCCCYTALFHYFHFICQP